MTRQLWVAFETFDGLMFVDVEFVSYATARVAVWKSERGYSHADDAHENGRPTFDDEGPSVVARRTFVGVGLGSTVVVNRALLGVS